MIIITPAEVAAEQKLLPGISVLVARSRIQARRDYAKRVQSNWIK